MVNPPSIIARLVRILAFAGGISCLYAGLLLYEDELGNAQNKLEEWWVWFDDQQRVALSKAALFMRATATLTGKLLAGIFGEKLISFRSVTVSSCFSLASFCLLAAIFTEAGHTARWKVAPIFFVVLGILSTRYVLARVSTVGIVAFIFLIFLILGEKTEAPTAWLHLHAGMTFAIVLAGGLLSDIAFVTLTRWLLRWTEQFELASGCITVFVADTLLGILLFLAPVMGSAIAYYRISKGITLLFFLLMIGCSNGFAFLISLFLVLVASLLLLHRLLWPTATRILYLVAPSKTQKVLLVLMGTSLLTVALGKPLSDEVKELLKDLGGGG